MARCRYIPSDFYWRLFLLKATECWKRETILEQFPSLAPAWNKLCSAVWHSLKWRESQLWLVFCHTQACQQWSDTLLQHKPCSPMKCQIVGFWYVGIQPLGDNYLHFMILLWASMSNLDLKFFNNIVISKTLEWQRWHWQGVDFPSKWLAILMTNEKPHFLWSQFVSSSPVI